MPVCLSAVAHLDRSAKHLNEERMKADKYAGIITVSAIILAVEYADSPYDIWDLLLGFLGLYLEVAYARNLSPCLFHSLPLSAACSASAPSQSCTRCSPACLKIITRGGSSRSSDGVGGCSTASLSCGWVSHWDRRLA